MLTAPSTRLEELEQRFSAIEPQLRPSPEKEALSVLHAMILENRRASNPPASGRKTLDDIANLYKSAPGMTGAAEAPGLPAGVPAPDFTLPDASGRRVSLSDFRGQNVVLVFYPLDWSPACSDQLSLYQAELDEVKRHNAQLVGISVDSLYSHGAWAAVRGLTFPLLADFHPRGEVAQLYRVWRKASGFSERALFIVDVAGIIRYAHVSPELPKVPDIYELFAQLQAIGQSAPAPVR